MDDIELASDICTFLPRPHIYRSGFSGRQKHPNQFGMYRKHVLLHDDSYAFVLRAVRL
ncbi:hypothetical protein LC1Hm_0217 [Halomicrobium sp. LC1Hm]|nr:hypothetical protein LC1Hm_0217 [Halomicrobium sp. LC1Hm]